MKVLFNPANCAFITGHKMGMLSVGIPKPRKEGEPIQLVEKTIVAGENELTQEEFDILDKMYPRAFTVVDAAPAPAPKAGKSAKASVPTNAERSQVIDQLKAGGLELEDLTAILDQYPGDKEIAKLAETAMGTL